MKPCIFCGSLADSKEDLFPRRVLRRVNTRQPLSRKIGNGPHEVTDDQEVRLACVCQRCNNTWMSGMESTVMRFLGPMIDDFSLLLDRQNQQNIAEWAVKCAMCIDTVEARPRFFTDAECHAFKQKRTIPHRTQVFAARFTGRSLDTNGADSALVAPGTQEPLVRGQVFNVMVGHAVLQVLSWRPEPRHEVKNFLIKPADGPWDRLTVRVWPIGKKSVNWPPPASLSTSSDVTHYGHFRARFKNGEGHQMFTERLKA